MKKRLASLVLCGLLGYMSSPAQNVALKTNLMYLATATPNLGVEASVGRKHTVQLLNTAIGSARASTGGSWVPISWAASSMSPTSTCRSAFSTGSRPTATTGGLPGEDSRWAISGCCRDTGTLRLLSALATTTSSMESMNVAGVARNCSRRIPTTSARRRLRSVSCTYFNAS